MQNKRRLLIPVLITFASAFSFCEQPEAGTELNRLSGNGDQDSKAFITTWDTTNRCYNSDSLDNQVRLPLVPGGEYDFEVDWGDGQTDSITSWDDRDKTHTYIERGIYDIRITGKIKGWSCGINSDKWKIIAIRQWGCLVIGNVTHQFLECDRLIGITADDVPDLSETVSLQGFFSGCRDLEEFGSIERWDTSTIIDMSDLFVLCRYFNEDISGWDTSNVTNMEDMFCRTDSFNQDISRWDVSNVTDMSGMFHMSTSFNQDLSGWDTSKVTDMSEMFQNAASFNGDISLWNVSGVRDMFGMFCGSRIPAYNYNRILKSWSEQDVQLKVEFHGGLSKYSSASAASRQKLIDEKGWEITDGGME